jgi:hypothetical protein
MPCCKYVSSKRLGKASVVGARRGGAERQLRAKRSRLVNACCCRLQTTVSSARRNKYNRQYRSKAMAEPPSPKRQRLSEPDGSKSQPTTPTRASFQSPTKASLARSHPNLLARSPGRDRNSGANSRGRNLRMSLLANRTVSLDGEAASSIPLLQSPKRGANVTPQAPITIASEKEGFSAAIMRTFTENRPRPSTSVRSPLMSRQPSASHPPRNEDRSPSPAKDVTPSFMKPTLVPRPESSSSSIRQVSSEPELPPTPVQLGLEPPAERPRGLISSSSSPRGSRSNSGKKRRRQRGHHTTSSPSKLREQVQIEEQQQTEQTSISRHELPAEAPESEFQQPYVQDDEDELPESIKQKQAEFRTVQAELAQLKADMRRLELTTVKEEPNLTPRTVKALTTIRSLSRSGSPDIVLPEMITMPVNPLPHLTLFTPAGLRITTATTAQKIGIELQQVHTVHVSAPVPYPPHIFGAKFDVHTNPQTTQIESVKLVRWHGDCATLHAAFRKWVEARLASNLHSKDISGLIWGMGSYWEFCVKRAGIWNTLLTGKLSDEESRPEELMKWLGRHSIEVSVSEGVVIALCWTAQLDWTGGVQERIGISCKGVPVKAHKMVMEVFDGRRKRKGILRAVEGVVKLLQDA